MNGGKNLEAYVQTVKYIVFQEKALGKSFVNHSTSLIASKLKKNIFDDVYVIDQGGKGRGPGDSGGTTVHTFSLLPVYGEEGDIRGATMSSLPTTSVPGDEDATQWVPVGEHLLRVLVKWFR